MERNWGFEDYQQHPDPTEEQQPGEGESDRNGCGGWTGNSDESRPFPNLFSSKLEMPVFDFPEEPEKSEGPRTGILPRSNLQSLGEELRATLGIQNRSDAVSDWMKKGEAGEGSQLSQLSQQFDVSANLQRQCVLDEPTWSNDESLQQLPSDFAPFTVEDGEDQGREEFERKKKQILERERREAAFRELSQRSSLDMQSSGDSRLSSNQQRFSQDQPRAGMLNKEQMIQALTYLLKTDPDFTEKLHKAYLLSCSKE
jgi:hypothetical protein